MIAAFLLWTLVGLIVGFVASRVVNLRGDDPRLGIVVSIIAAIVGGIVYRMMSDNPAIWTNVWNYLWPAIVSALAVVIWHFARTRGTYKRPTFRQSY